MHNIENKCKKFKIASTFIYFAKSSLQNTATLVNSFRKVMMIGY